MRVGPLPTGDGALLGRRDSAAPGPAAEPVARWRWAASAGAGLLTLTFALQVTAPFGPGVSYDSVYYLSAAKSLASGDGLASFESEPMVDWPPLFPLLLGLGSALGLDPVAWARGLGAGLTAALVALACAWFAPRLTSDLLFGVGTLLLCLAPPLALVASWVWSEPLFLFLAFVGLQQGGRHLRTGNLPPLAAAAACAALAGLARYAALPLLVAGAASALFRTGDTRRAKLLRALLFLVLASAPAALWGLRNRQLAGHAAGYRNPSAATLAESLRSAVYDLSQWFFPTYDPGGGPAQYSRLGAYLSAALLAGLLGALLAAAIRAARCRPATLRGLLPDALPFALFAGAYLAFMVAAASTVGFEGLNQRLMAPIFVPTACLVLLVADRLACHPGGPPRRLAACRTALAAVLLWPVGHATAQAFHRLDHDRRQGVGGYTSAAWRGSELVAALGRMPEGAEVFSNGAEAVHFFTGRQADWTPARASGDAVGDRRSSRERFLERIAGASAAHLVWFRALERDHWFNEREVVAMLEGRAELVLDSGDGRIYRVGPL